MLRRFGPKLLPFQLRLVRQAAGTGHGINLIKVIYVPHHFNLHAPRNMLLEYTRESTKIRTVLSLAYTKSARCSRTMQVLCDLYALVPQFEDKIVVLVDVETVAHLR